jgi:hypothetical protein
MKPAVATPARRVGLQGQEHAGYRAPMASPAGIRFTDRKTRDDAWIGVRVHANAIGLTTSLSTNGEVEVFFGRSEAEALREALAVAVRSLR